MTTISAKTILRSRNASAPEKVLSTLLLRYPRWIHAEQRTHRLVSLEEGIEFIPATPSLMADPNLSRNAASSRAIPVKKMIDDVRADPATPLWWGKNVSGMQAPEELTGDALESVKKAWSASMEAALAWADLMAMAGAHKQIVNRALEPYSHITVLVSATEWENFLELRDHTDAEPHIQILAREIRKCLEDESTIQTLQPGEWHLPFITHEDRIDVEDTKGAIEALKALSVARCASTSYKTVDGFDMTLDRAQAVFDKLVTSKPIHASPLEHVAQADIGDAIGYPGDFYRRWHNQSEYRNFVGFRQYRAMVGA